MSKKPKEKIKILYLDIETAPIVAHVWGLWDNNVALNQIKQDWFIISWAAKWKGIKRVYQEDSRNSKDMTNDKPLLKGMWRLMDEADVIVTQNGKKFDIKKLNARFILNGLKPPSSYHQVDTLEMAKKNFGFTSNKLEYLSSQLNTKYKKLKHKKFPGFELWDACLKGIQSAWKEMARYNIYDVLALEELHQRLESWDSSLSLHFFEKGTPVQCRCGNSHLQKYGFSFSNKGKFQRYKCSQCKTEISARTNLLNKKRTA